MLRIRDSSKTQRGQSLRYWAEWKRMERGIRGTREYLAHTTDFYSLIFT
jgi:hypothetical protein